MVSVAQNNKMRIFGLIIVSFATCTTAHLSFTNLKCEMFDRKFGNFETCLIKAVNRTHKYIDIHARLLKLPIKNVSIQIDPMRYDNGYRAFLLGMNFDVCKYMKNPTHRSMVFLRELHLTFVKSSNLNHTCPYNHDLKIEKLYTGDLEKGFLQILPIPNGDYAIFSKWYAHNIPRGNIKVFFKITNN